MVAIDDLGTKGPRQPPEPFAGANGRVPAALSEVAHLNGRDLQRFFVPAFSVEAGNRDIEPVTVGMSQERKKLALGATNLEAARHNQNPGRHAAGSQFLSVLGTLQNERSVAA
jgi:hypothetical protein